MPFNGRASYDDFAQIGEDVSPIIEVISPAEVPLLSRLPQAPRPVTNTFTQWTEEELGPNTIINSTAINSATAATGIQINGFGGQLQVGMLLQVMVDQAGDYEILQISSIPGANSLLCTRQFGSSGVNSLAAGGELFVISTADLEGSDTSGDVTRARTRRDNFTQIFKKPITVSRTRNAVVMAPDIGSEYDLQATRRVIEVVRDLEKAVVRSRRSGNSQGADDTYRTMAGLQEFITDINSTVTASSFTAAPITYINDLMQQAWNEGARDINLILAGSQWKRDISSTNASSLQVTQDERGIERLVEFIITDFGSVEVLISPWLPQQSLMGLATSRITVPPLRGSAFQREDLAPKGDYRYGHVVGEYTVQVSHPDKMFRARRA